MVLTRLQKSNLVKYNCKNCINKVLIECSSSDESSSDESSSDESSSDESNLSDISDDISEYDSENSNFKKTNRMIEKTWNKNTRANNIDVLFETIPISKIGSKRKHTEIRKKKATEKKATEKKATDSDIDEWESADETNDPDYKIDNVCQDFVNEVIESMVDETNDKIQERKELFRSKKWKRDLSKSDIKKYNPEYIQICNVVSYIPTIQTVLQVNMPFITKCDLFERLIILDNTPTDTVEHLCLKKAICDEFEKYKKSNLNKKIYKKYEIIEKKLEENDFIELPIKYKILGSEMSFDNKISVYKKYKNWVILPEHSSEHPKLLNWITTILELPTKITPLPISVLDESYVISKFLYDVRYRLNKEVYGMQKAKEQILCILNNKITNPKLIGSSIALQGVQGSGKTKLIQVLAKAIDIPFTSIPLGGATDSGYLLGHGFTYEGSRPGCIVDALIKMKSLSSIIFFDEVDKISTTNYGQEISKALLHITDFTQNHEFSDKYLGNEIKINLSNMWFIYSLNYSDLIDKTLADRIPIIQVDGYTNTQKKDMAQKYLIKDALKNINYNLDDIIFSEEALTYLITETNKMYDKSTQDKNGNSGVRKLKESIHNVITKLNFLKNTRNNSDLKVSFTIKNFKIPFTVMREHINKLDVLNKEESSGYQLSMYL
jgi:ATP-dependent Lon protease